MKAAGMCWQFLSLGEECVQYLRFSKLGYGFQFFIIKHFLKLSKKHRIVFCVRKDFEVLQAEAEEGEQPPPTQASLRPAGIQERGCLPVGPLCFNSSETTLCQSGGQRNCQQGTLPNIDVAIL